MAVNQHRLVSVVMAVFNGADLIKESVLSILEQTYTNFELIIINDGSIDDTSKVLHSINDSRIKLFENSENKGLIYSLNYGVNKAKGEFIARMDADDISLPERIEKQVQTLANNPSLVGVGSWITLIDNDNNTIGLWEYPESHKMIKWNQLFNSAMAHPSIMFVANAFRKTEGYSLNHKYAEDYELWSRLATIGQLYNLQHSLLLYRVHQNSISQTSSENQKLAKQAISHNNISQYVNETELNKEIFQIDPYNCSRLTDLTNILLIRQKFVEKECPSKKDANHIDKYIVGVAIRILSKVTVNDKVCVAKKVCGSNISFNNKIMFLLKCLLFMIKPSK